MSTDITSIIEQTKGLIVSCQAYPGEALRTPEVTARMCQAVVAGGAVAVRVQGVVDISAARQAVEVPVIGLIKYGHDGVYITPSTAHARACALAGASIVAIDATNRPRLGGESFADAVRSIHEEFPGVAIMADCGSLDDALRAEEAGADLIGTTLAGYTGDREKTAGPDFELIDAVCEHITRPIIVEGRIHTISQLKEVFTRPIHAACVGTAITHPTSITSWFSQAIEY
ncbi:N-acetylmannosamine-6-phosphate 2-epimerase [Corynebacterium sp. ES2794-CONJ1]|uniref:N-acetylmannosamine-6-phosphate 2-epimerase n=1 Tax=unclassified Corynebacterium TaxID=2624378 RepID=UPI00216A9CF4|nr:MULTISPECIES: N-acetylmannosamine-6-phosphate 2-epimerase [unclassified Corynebacterium]MCS4489992.1 N-acetylmannosamine-6-phosphate 2-epimerase [Corynebacterium sp. ES2775-CONJ]MCU9519146.1 N-acetylmannosamine-6-phosphate 2-epimerase [Corynebacterium sp. ES2794-CONJ1]